MGDFLIRESGVAREVLQRRAWVGEPGERDRVAKVLIGIGPAHSVPPVGRSGRGLSWPRRAGARPGGCFGSGSEAIFGMGRATGLRDGSLRSSPSCSKAIGLPRAS